MSLALAVSSESATPGRLYTMRDLIRVANESKLRRGELVVEFKSLRFDVFLCVPDDCRKPAFVVASPIGDELPEVWRPTVCFKRCEAVDLLEPVLAAICSKGKV